jgi:ABC-type Fe3+-hydroxamate transport system substrate-binding protein
MFPFRASVPSPGARKSTLLVGWMLGICASGCTGEEAALLAPSEELTSTRPVTLGDGSTLQVPDRAQRILPATSAAVDLLADLKLHDRVVAVPLAAFSWSVAAHEPERWSEHTILNALEGEAILALKPDLIIAAPWSYQGPLWVARSVNIPVLPLPDAKSWQEIEAGITLAGRALGVQDRARALMEDLTARRSRLAGAGRPSRRMVAYSNFGAGGHTSGTGTTLDLAIALAGMKNAVGRKGHCELSLEEILSLNPEVFLTSTGRDMVSPGAEFLRNEPTLSHLEAVEEGRIIVLPAELFSASSHRILDAAEEVARQVDLLFN